MAQAKLATWRIRQPYVVDGLPHHSTMYVKSTGASVGGIIQVIDRNAANVSWRDAADQFSSFIGQLCSNVTVPGDAVLEQKSGLMWLPVSFHTPTFPTQAAAYSKCSIVTISMRDTAFNRVKAVVCEGVYAPPAHYIGNVGAPTGVGQSFAQVQDSASHPADPFFVMVSLSNHYLAASGAWIAATITLDRKYRRRRNLA